MSGAEAIVAVLIGSAAAYLVFRLFAGPLRWLAFWLLRSAAGAAALWILQWPASLLGWHVGVNAWTALAVGALGAPGLVLLYGLQAVLR